MKVRRIVIKIILGLFSCLLHLLADVFLQSRAGVIYEYSLELKSDSLKGKIQLRLICFLPFV